MYKSEYIAVTDSIYYYIYGVVQQKDLPNMSDLTITIMS